MKTPIREFPFPAPGPDHFKLTCKNHPDRNYLTKNPYQRHLHYLGTNTNPFAPECSCPFDNLVVITDDTGADQLS